MTGSKAGGAAGGKSGRLAAKTVLVTAAGQGIGRASVLAMAAEGARVIATDINDKALAALAEQGIETRHLNVRDGLAVQAIARDFPETDVLFNCAGLIPEGTILDCTDEDWAFGLDINLGSMFRLCRAFLPGMIAKGGGSVINMASVAGPVTGARDRFGFCTTKAGVVGLTRSIAADFAQDGIRCNAICPGSVSSPSHEARLRASGDYEAALAAEAASLPMGRAARPEEVAQLVVWLASDDSSYTTGTTQIIDGGQSIF